MRTLVAVTTIGAAASAALAQDVLVVAPSEFDVPVDAWKIYRESQGLVVAVSAPPDDLAQLVKQTHEKSGKKLKFVMLVGDAEWVPCAVVPRKAGGPMAGMDPDPNIATDAPFADLDGDSVPDLAIGRVPADTAVQAGQYFHRVMQYETNADFGPWRAKLNLVAGTGNFGPMVDLALEKLTRDLLASVPASVDVSMTYAHHLSAFCPPPAEFSDYAVRRWNEGALVVGYVGHGSECNVDRCRFGKDSYPILDVSHVAKLRAEHGAPVSVFIACSTGHFDGEPDCLAEEMVKKDGGPIGVIASSRVSSPYSNGIVAKELLDALYGAKSPTTGELLVEVKRRLLDAPAGDVMRTRIETMAAAAFDKSVENRRADRVDHLALYNLLGDPCVRIARPVAMPLTAPEQVVQGAIIDLDARADFDGTATIELVRRKPPPPKVPAGRTAPEDFRSVYEAANSHVLARVQAPVKDGRVQAQIAVPADAPTGPAAVRVYIEGKAASAAGAAELTILAASAPTPPK